MALYGPLVEVEVVAVIVCRIYRVIAFTIEGSSFISPTDIIVLPEHEKHQKAPAVVHYMYILPT